MDLKDQLQKLFPNHTPEKEENIEKESLVNNAFTQKEPLLCKYEKRKGKPTTIIGGFEIDESKIKYLAKEIKEKFAIGGSIKDNEIILQGDYRDKIMKFLVDKSFKVKRVGG